LIADGKVERTLKQRDIIMMRGTNHEWVNRGKELARLFAVLVRSNFQQEGCDRRLCEVGEDSGWGYF
jgi:hypothetical protein